MAIPSSEAILSNLLLNSQFPEMAERVSEILIFLDSVHLRVKDNEANRQVRCFLDFEKISVIGS